MARKNNKLLKAFSEFVLRLFNLTRLYTTTSDKDELNRLNSEQFQHLLREYYRQLGYQVNQEQSQQPDTGSDIEFTKFGQVSLVQCKHWKCRKVGVKAIREMYDVLLNSEADRLVIVTSGEFTLDAYRFARGKSLRLINGIQLTSMLTQANQSLVQPETV